MPNAKILVLELVESAPNVPWTITIPSVVVLQDMLAIPLTGVSWTRSPHPSLILAILHLVDLELGVLLPNKATDMPTPFVDVNLALFPNLIPSLDVDLNVQGILIAQVVMSVITKDVLKNLILAILLLVVLEQDV